MARMAYNSVLDAGLLAMETAVEGVGGRMYVCSGEPADFTGIAAVKLATTAAPPVLTIAEGDAPGNGRKCTISAENGVSITGSGTATHIALASVDTLWFVTTCTPQELTSGGTVDIPAWKIQVLDPTAPA